MKAPALLDPETFTRFGFFAKRAFLSRGQCLRLRRILRTSPDRPGEVWMHGRSTLARDKRRVSVLEPSARTRAWVDQAFRRIMPLLGRHFGRRLSGHEGVQYLRYPEGGHYVLHTDRTPGTRDPQVRRRKVSLIVFLSPAGRGPGRHLGGELVFPWAGSGKSRTRYPLAVRSEAGLLVAFDPGIEHEVRRVRRGTRFSLATWYY